MAYKRGFRNPFRVDYEEVNVGTLARFAAGSERNCGGAAGAAGWCGRASRVKVLGNGELTGRADGGGRKLLEVGASAKIEAAGGSVRWLNGEPSEKPAETKPNSVRVRTKAKAADVAEKAAAKSAADAADKKAKKDAKAESGRRTAEERGVAWRSQLADNKRSSRPRLLQAVFDAVQQPDIRKKLLFTAAMLVVFRFIAHIPIPGVDPRQLEAAFNSERAARILQPVQRRRAEARERGRAGRVSVHHATIIMQLITPIFPSLASLQKEGEAGRHRLELYQYWMTVPLCFVQGYAQLVILHTQCRAVAPRRRHVQPVAHRSRTRCHGDGAVRDDRRYACSSSGSAS